MEKDQQCWKWHLQGVAWSYLVMTPGLLCVILFATELREDGKITFRPKDVPESVINLAIAGVGLGIGIRKYPQIAGKLLPDSEILEAVGRKLIETSKSSEKENGNDGKNDTDSPSNP